MILQGVPSLTITRTQYGFPLEDKFHHNMFSRAALRTTHHPLKSPFVFRNCSNRSSSCVGVQTNPTTNLVRFPFQQATRHHGAYSIKNLSIRHASGSKSKRLYQF